MKLERIGPHHAMQYKTIRLTALRTDPLAFGSTYDRELLLTDEDWSARAASLDGEERVGFLAVQQGEACGLVLCFRGEDDPEIAQVISMWVSPSARRSGVGSSLLEAVRAWAESRGMTTLRLLVTETNSAAIQLYERNAYRRTGRTEPYPNLPDTCEVEMSRSTANTSHPAR